MNIAVIMAGGTGERMKLSLPKQFAPIKGIPMAAYSLAAFSKHSGVDKIYIVCAEKWRGTFEKIVEDYHIEKVCGYVLPGKTRRESSENAIRYISKECSPDDVVMIHDAARPGITGEIIDRNIAAAERTGACCTAIGCRDTLCKISGDRLSERVSREDTVMLQTPQTFRLGIILKAHEKYKKALESGEKVPEITDDTGLVAFAGGKVTLAEGTFSNMKVTEPGDVEIMEGIFAGKMQKHGKYIRK